MHLSTRGAAAAAAFIITAGCTAAVVAQAVNPPAGSLGELTAEIRQLRQAIEQSTRNQTQAQTLGIFLTTQDRRLMIVTSRLEEARRQITNFSQQTSVYAQQLSEIDEQLPRTTDSDERTALEDRSKEIKFEMKAVAAREQEARTREGEALHAFQLEEARWNDLIARLQGIVER